VFRGNKKLNDENKTKKAKNTTVSLPRRLAEAIQESIDELGCWINLDAFVREAALEKLRNERQPLAKYIPVTVLSCESEEKKEV